MKSRTEQNCHVGVNIHRNITRQNNPQGDMRHLGDLCYLVPITDSEKSSPRKGREPSS